jgi:hypothetical protein
MAKHDVDPVFRELVRSVNESGQAVVPVVLTVHGTVLHGALISERRYFTELTERMPLMSALEPSSGLLGKDYVKDVENESGYYLHLRAARLAGIEGEAESLWRIGVGTVDAWSLPAHAGSDEDDKGPFARLLSNT